MSLSESDKDHIAEIVHWALDRLQSGAPEYWRGGNPERRLADELADKLGPEEYRYAVSLVGQIARDERPDPVIERINRASDGIVPKDSR